MANELNEQQLIERTAKAIAREAKAREAFEVARIEEDEARKEAMAAWSALRNYQDKQVATALRLVA